MKNDAAATGFNQWPLCFLGFSCLYFRNSRAPTIFDFSKTALQNDKH